MKFKLILMNTLFIACGIFAMEEPEAKKAKLSNSEYHSELEDIIIGEISPEFRDAWALTNNQETPSLKAITAFNMFKNQITISENQIPEELEDYIKILFSLIMQINSIRACSLSEKEKIILLNIVNNPNFDIVGNFSVFSNGWADGKSRNASDRQTALDTILIKGCDRRDIYLICLALCLGANANAQISNGKTPLMFVVGYRKKQKVIAIIELFIKTGVNINAQSTHGTALVIAIKSLRLGFSHPSIISLLLSLGANPNIPYRRGETSLMLAVKSELEKVVEELLLAGADPTLQNYDGQTTLDLANELCSDSPGQESQNIKKLIQEATIFRNGLKSLNSL